MPIFTSREAEDRIRSVIDIGKKFQAAMKPTFITFTGADDQVDVAEMVDISREYPVEWGILFSLSRQGIDPRYPSPDGVFRLLQRSGLNCSAHLCGSYSQSIMDRNFIPFFVDLARFRRIQINHVEPNIDSIIQFQHSIGVPCVAQARGTEFPPDHSISWLFDASGGRGLAPAAWPMYPGRSVGYAGGINHINVCQTIVQINASGPYWLDMESGVRTDNRFDLALVRSVCSQVFDY